MCSCASDGCLSAPAEKGEEMQQRNCELTVLCVAPRYCRLLVASLLLTTSSSSVGRWCGRAMSCSKRSIRGLGECSRVWPKQSVCAGDVPVQSWHDLLTVCRGRGLCCWWHVQWITAHRGAHGQVYSRPQPSRVHAVVLHWCCQLMSNHVSSRDIKCLLCCRYTAAGSRNLCLKQCLQLPKPLWREVR
jgi:hypothetical protein